MTTEADEPWWTQQDADTAWIARQEAISAAFAAATRAAKLAQPQDPPPAGVIDPPEPEPPAV